MSKSVEATAPITAGTSAAAAHGAGYRWGQLVLGIVCMAMIANRQYGWGRATVPAVLTNFAR